MLYLSVAVPGGRVGEVWSGVSRAGRRWGGEGGGGEGGSHVAPPAQGGWREGRSIQSHTADPALDLLRPQLCALLLFLDQPGGGRSYSYIHVQWPVYIVLILFLKSSVVFFYKCAPPATFDSSTQIEKIEPPNLPRPPC